MYEEFAIELAGPRRWSGTDESMMTVKAGRAKAPQKRSIQMKKPKILASLKKGIGMTMITQNQAFARIAFCAATVLAPPKYDMTLPLTMKPESGAVAATKEKIPMVSSFLAFKT